MKNDPTPYETKFAKLIEALKSDVDILVVAELWVIGDTPAEIVESMRRIAVSGKTLAIADPGLNIEISLTPTAR